MYIESSIKDIKEYRTRALDRDVDVEVLLNRAATDAQREEKVERRAGVLGNWDA
jgi:hypothetical protein